MRLSPQKERDDIISVTTALSPYSDFSMIQPYILELAGARGTRVHRAIAAYALGFPALGLWDEDHGYFVSFASWLDNYVSEVLLVEKRLISPLGFTGQIDLVCILTDARLVVVDSKTPAIEAPTWKSQISAYCELAKVELMKKLSLMERPMLEGMALMLNKEGKAAKGIVYQYQADDFAAFLSALNCKRYFGK